MANNKASDLIEAALNEAFKLELYEDFREGDILNEWVVIGYVTNADESQGSGYPMLFSNGSMPKHVARGLLHTALRTLDAPDDD